MEFEKCLRGQPEDIWEPISIDELRKVTTPKEREQMIYQKAVIRGDKYKYRRKIPSNLKDWAKDK